jgi:peptide deformylase
MPLNIVQIGAIVLRQRARSLSIEKIRSREIQRLIENMRETMYKAPGVGLAAPQIGKALQISVIEDKPEYVKEIDPKILKERERTPVPFHVIINPRITLENETVEFFEGCLSLTGFTAAVSRARRVRVDCLDHKGQSRTIEASGWYARILQHEIDHLDGTLYIDRMDSRTFTGMENFNLHWKQKSMAEIRQLLHSD